MEILDYRDDYCIKSDENYIIKDVIVKEKTLYLSLKRCFDFFVSLIAFVFLLPIMIVVAILIKLDSEGPIIYAQERLGKNGKKFMMYKFRSMNINAEEDGPRWASDDDERCTRFGKIMRKCRLDELPQLINIIKGEMSIVGPRPEREYFYNEFNKYIEGFDKRLLVKPGLTGYAQVNGGYDLKPEEKIVFDMFYIENMSFKLDFWCLIYTVRLLFTHEGAR